MTGIVKTLGLLLVVLCMGSGKVQAHGTARLASEPLLVDPSATTLLRLVGRPQSDPAGWRTLPDSAFRAMEGRDIWMGWKSGHSLLRLPLKVEKAGRWWIQVDYPGLDSVRVEANGKATGWIGDDVPRSRWVAPWHGPHLPLDLVAGDNVVHIHTVGTHGRLGLVVRLRTDHDQMRGAEDEALRDGLFAGVFLANLLLAIWLFAVVRHPAHFWYVLYQSVVLVFLFCIHHHSFAWLWPETLQFNLVDRTASSLGAFGIIAMFLLRLLDLDVTFPRLGRLLRWMSTALLCFTVLQLLHPWYRPFFEFFYQDSRIEVMEGGTYLLAILLVLGKVWKGDHLARWVLMAMIPMAAALGISLGAELLRLPWMYAWRGVVVEIGLTLENLLLSLILVQRVVRERRDHQSLLERHLALELDFSRRLAQETDRNLRGTAMDLHDGVGQELAGMSLYLRTILKQAGKPELTESVSKELGRVMESVRQSAHRIYPPELMEGGLRHALDRLAKSLRVSGKVSVSIEGTLPNLGEDRAIHWYRIIQEAISNAQRHGQARHISVRLMPGRLEVEDDGIGLPAQITEGLGLHSLRHRAALLGAELVLAPSPTGPGALLSVTTRPA